MRGIADVVLGTVLCGLQSGSESLIVLCIYFETECEVGRGRERQTDRQTQRIPSRLCRVSTELNVALELRKPWDHDLNRNQESDA